MESCEFGNESSEDEHQNLEQLKRFGLESENTPGGRLQKLKQLTPEAVEKVKVDSDSDEGRNFGIRSVAIIEIQEEDFDY